MKRFIMGHNRVKRGECGSILVMTAIFMLGLLLALGAAIDASRFYMMRAELQNAADASALAAARELNSTVTGIQDAAARATAVANTYNINKTAVTFNANTGIEFAINLDAPDSAGRRYVSLQTFNSWDAATQAAFASDVRFVRVTTEAKSIGIIFSQALMGANHTEARSATAGMSIGINGVCDFFPIAVALDDPTPTPGTVMTLNFTQGTGNSATVANMDYIVLEVPDINGNGAPETAVLSAGLTSICQSLGEEIEFHMTPSSNVNNGPKQIADGVNTRFNMYANGYGNALQPGTYPPDRNINQTITWAQYSGGESQYVTTPSNPPAEEPRRIMVTPVVTPGTYNPPTTQTVAYAVWFMRTVTVYDHPCSNALSGCARMEVEYIGDDFTLGRGFYECGNGNTNISLPVLYR